MFEIFIKGAWQLSVQMFPERTELFKESGLQLKQFKSVGFEQVEHDK